MKYLQDESGVDVGVFEKRTEKRNRGREIDRERERRERERDRGGSKEREEREIDIEREGGRERRRYRGRDISDRDELEMKSCRLLRVVFSCVGHNKQELFRATY